VSDGTSPPIPRRRLLMALAACVAPFGCSGSASKASRNTSACATPSDGGSNASYCLVQGRVVRVADAQTLQVGQARLTNIDDNTAVIVARDAQGFHALSAICTHACCLVSLCRETGCLEVTSNPGECGTSDAVSAGETTSGIACPCHGSNFRLIDGAPTKGPALRPLPSYAMTFDGRDALVDTARTVQPTFRV
jgi:Rieske Fe-S protein